MPKPAETKAIKDFVFENPKNLEVAYLVHETWPFIRDQVCEDFLRHLCARIKDKGSLHEGRTDVNIGFVYGGNRPHLNWVWLSRGSWKPFATDPSFEHPPNGNRTAIVLEADSKGPNNWFINVRTPVVLHEVDDVERSRHGRMQEQLKTELGRSDGQTKGRWPWWRYVRTDARHWEYLVPQLNTECGAQEDGEVTRYLVDEFVNVATKAIPVLDKIENTET